MYLSLGRFVYLIKSISPNTYYLVSLSSRRKFNNMEVFFNPNSVCFRNNSEYFCLNLVSHVIYDETEPTGRHIFKIVCNSFLYKNKEEYSLIVY